jgi:hypothetical protein
METGKSKYMNGIKLFNFGAGADTPLYKETKSVNGWIEFGQDNLLPNYYISLMSRSSIHNAIMKGKSQMIGGNGFNKDKLSTEALNFLKNPYNENDMEEILARISYDLEIFGAFCLNIVWSKDRKRIAEINYMTPQSLRVGNPDKEHPNVESYYICEDWENWRKKDVVKYPGFSVVNRGEASQILYVKEYKPGRYFYGEPEYSSSVRWIELDYEVSFFHLSNIKNGFSPSLIINYTSEIPSDEEMDLLMRRTNNEYKGAGSAGKVIYTFSKDKDSAPIITPIDPNNSDERFLQLNDQLTQGIFTGHRVTNPSIFGVRDKGGLITNKSDLLDSLEMFQSMYVTPKQRFIEKCLNRLANINGVTDKIEIAEYQMKFSKMDLDISSLMLILNSTLPAVQKIAILNSNGYTEEEAKEFVGNGIVVQPPAPTGPSKINPPA